MKIIIDFSVNDDELVKIVQSYFNSDVFNLTDEQEYKIIYGIFDAVLALAMTNNLYATVSLTAVSLYKSTLLLGKNIELFCFHTLLHEIIDTESFKSVRNETRNILSKFNLDSNFSYGRSLVDYWSSIPSRVFILEIADENDNN